MKNGSCINIKTYIISFNLEHLDDERLEDENSTKTNEEIKLAIENILKNYNIDIQQQLYTEIGTKAKYSNFWVQGHKYSSELELVVEEDFHIEELLNEFKKISDSIVLIEDN